MSDRLPGQPEDTAPAHRGHSLRLFISVELSVAWRDAAEQVARELETAHGRDYRWVRPELYHVTLVFLGEQPRERLDAIEAAMRAAASGVPPFELQMGGLSGFGVDVPRALILAIADPSVSLQSLRRRLDHELAARRIPYDRKALQPHLTLGRARVQRGRPREARRSGGSGPPTPQIHRPNVGPLSVTDVALVKSDLLPGGPRYEALTRVPLRQT